MIRVMSDWIRWMNEWTWMSSSIEILSDTSIVVLYSFCALSTNANNLNKQQHNTQHKNSINDNNSYMMITIVWALNGYVQGMGFAPCAKLLKVWWDQNQRGTWWGLVSTAQVSTLSLSLSFFLWLIVISELWKLSAASVDVNTGHLWGISFDPYADDQKYL